MADQYVAPWVSRALLTMQQVAPKIPEPGKEAGFGPEMHKAGQAEAAGMATGGGGISPPKRGLATSAGPNPLQAPGGGGAAAGLQARSFAGRMGLSLAPSPNSGRFAARRMSTPSGPDDSMHNPPHAGWTPADRGETGGRPSVGADDAKELAVRACIEKGFQSGYWQLHKEAVWPLATDRLVAPSPSQRAGRARMDSLHLHGGA